MKFVFTDVMNATLEINANDVIYTQPLQTFYFINATDSTEIDAADVIDATQEMNAIVGKR